MLTLTLALLAASARAETAFVSDGATDKPTELEFLQPLMSETPFDGLVGSAATGKNSKKKGKTSASPLRAVEQVGYGSSCCNTCCDTCCEPCCCPPAFWRHRSGIWGEYLYLHATDADLTHAQQQNGTGGAGTVPFGRIGVLDPNYQPGFRAGVNMALSACSSIGVSYSFFESNSLDTVAQPVITGGGGTVGSFVHHPGASITGSVGPVNAEYGIDFQTGEAFYRRVWRGGERYAINWLVGGRYGNLDQDFIQTGVFGGSLGGQIDTSTEINFDGGGLLFGLDGERRLGCSGFSIYAKTSIAPMRGSFQADYRMLNTTTSVLLAESRWKDDRTVALLDYEAGLAWTGPCGNWRFAAGYLGSHWFNTLTTAEFIQAVQANSYTAAGDTLSFDGLTARVEWRW